MEPNPTNQYPVTRIQSEKSSGGATTEGEKLYKNGTLFGCIFSRFVFGSLSVLFLQRLTCPAVAFQKMLSNMMYFVQPATEH
ncbi:hypothetical protein HYQ46_004873 [Verticillium longisporum]|nr:hypothetical protein HYQ46_004873 [Verticillium longisporum]